MKMLLLMVAVTTWPAVAAESDTTCALTDCMPAIESFPPEPCAGQKIPRDVRRRMVQVKSVVTASVDGQPAGPRPARTVLKWLRRASRDTKEAGAEGKLTAVCADVLEGLLRNAKACASCPALREMPKGMAPPS
ncbi:MAG TPA: hypothetical protein VGR62_24185 [Candidatus Binatia bacterium]|nr:hypothetical protein [Candidatus Binatia bacterium]